MMAARELQAFSGAPRGETGKVLISPRGILEWAFGTEKASLDYDEISEALYGRAFAGMGAECRIAEQLALGKRRGEGVRVDTSIGRSYPHDDAEMVATVLRNSVGWGLALRVAELARAGQAEDWGQGLRLRCEPLAWRACKHGDHAQTDRAGLEVYVYRGRVRRAERRHCPVRFRNTARDLAARRRNYLAWWGALLDFSVGVKAVELQRFEVTGAMPPMRPWKKTS